MHEAAAQKAETRDKKSKVGSEATRKPATVPKHTPPTSGPAPAKPAPPSVVPKEQRATEARRISERKPKSEKDPVPSTSGNSQVKPVGAKGKGKTGPTHVPVAVFNGLSDEDMSMSVNASVVAGISGSLQEDGTFSAPTGFLNPILRRAAEKALRPGVFNKYIEALMGLMGAEHRAVLSALSMDQLVIRVLTKSDGARTRWSVDHIEGLSGGPLLEAVGQMFVRPEGHQEGFVTKCLFEKDVGRLFTRAEPLLSDGFRMVYPRPAPPKKKGGRAGGRTAKSNHKVPRRNFTPYF